MNRPSVAIVEDNEDNLALIDAILEEEFELTFYRDGRSALDGLRASSPAVVLLDISLPGMSGEEVLAELRADERTKALPVVALTAHAMAGDEERFLSLGFDAYFSKPIVDDLALIALVRRLGTR